MSYLSMQAESALLPLIYRCAPIQEIIDKAFEFLDNPIRFSPENKIEFAITSENYPESEIQLISDMLSNDANGFNTFIKMLQTGEDKTRPILKEHPDDFNRVFCYVALGDRYFGNITITLIRHPEQVDLDLIQVISKMVALACSVDGTWGYRIEERNMFISLLNGRINSQIELAGHVQNWQRYQNRTFRLVGAAVDSPSNIGIIASGLSRVFPDSLTACDNDIVYLLLDDADDHIDDTVLHKLSIMANKLQTTIFIGHPFSDILTCRNQKLVLYTHARINHKHKNTVIFTDDNLIYSLLFESNLSDKKLMTYCNPDILQMMETDKKEHSEYFSTLKTYCLCHFDANLTAQRLNTHKNTVNYRLRKIEERYHLSLSNSTCIFNIMLSVHILDYLEIR